MTRRDFFRGSAGVAAAAACAGFTSTARLEAQTAAASRLPNIVLIYCDDLGYGDIAPYGSKIETPNLTRMAAEGVMLRQFYASPVCSVSRAALLTGRYGVRCGVPGVMHPGDTYGLGLNEVTIPEILKAQGYRTACIGKWHLGTRPQYMPTRRGFDSYYGIPYSNDQEPSVLMRGTEVIEAPVDQDSLTQRYTQEAINFIQASKDAPFFLYLPHAAPHIPLFASREFRGKSKLGLYGDSVMEVDWSTGQILDTLANLGLDSNTLVIFSSDNGPWFQGRAGSLRGRKGDTFEGGMRVPFLARFPGRLPAGKVIEPFATTLDLLPTLANLAGVPGDAVVNPLDGVDIWPMLTGAVKEFQRPLFLYLREFDVQAARFGKWKLHVARENAPPYAPNPPQGRMNLRLMNPELYDLEEDPDESYSVAASNPRVVADLQARINAALQTMPQSVRDAWRATQARPVGWNKDGEWPQPAI